MYCKFKRSDRRHFPAFELTAPTTQILSTSKEYKNIPRHYRYVESIEPTRNLIKRTGDYACKTSMEFFGFNNVFNTDLQSDEKGRAVLNRKDAVRAAGFKNPLRDPLIVSKLLNGTAHLKDGFHRLFEAKERGYMGPVWIIVLDESIDLLHNKH